MGIVLKEYTADLPVVKCITKRPARQHPPYLFLSSNFPADLAIAADRTYQNNPTKDVVK